MELKTSVIGIFLYAVMFCYVLAYALRLSKKVKLSDMLFMVGFIINFSAVIYRWIWVAHLPMQTIFEIFLCLTALVYPLSVFTQKYLAIDSVLLDIFIAILLIFPAGFVFSAQPRLLPPALQSALFGPHVAAYMLSYVLMFKAAAISAAAIMPSRSAARVKAEADSYTMVCLGFPLLTLGLLLGCFWAKVAWGRFWGWDPKELWSLVSWLAFVVYLHFRYRFGTKYVLINHWLVIIGMVFIVLTLVWVNLSRVFTGLHNYAG
ncbi:MAG: cytochrome c biogenesis protein CcsA [Sedimentisphaeraceae bacterium JB056]